jgi:dCMP deaminase
VLVSKDNKVLATGYNGVPSNFPHCIDEPCEGAKYMSGLGLDKCEAIHAEQNALLQVSDVNLIETAYCTTAPCIHCLKLLLNTSCHKIVFNQDYPHSAASKALWEKAGRIWQHTELEI